MTDLVEEIDAAAAELLKRATAPDKDESDNPTLVTLSERTKAFDSVVDWAKVRQGLVPPDKTPSKFEQIKGALDGTGTGKSRRRRGASSEAEAEAGPNGADRAGDLSDGLFAT